MEVRQVERAGVLGLVVGAQLEQLQATQGRQGTERVVGGAFRPDLAMAERLLDEVAGVLGEPAATTERLAILAKQGAAPETFNRIAEQFERLPRTAAVQALERLAGSNENAYISLVQRRLTDLALYDGSPDGVLTGATIEAFRRACDAAGALEKCDRGPLTSDAVRLMSAFLFTARAAAN